MWVKVRHLTLYISPTAYHLCMTMFWWIIFFSAFGVIILAVYKNDWRCFRIFMISVHLQAFCLYNLTSLAYYRLIWIAGKIRWLSKLWVLPITIFSEGNKCGGGLQIVNESNKKVYEIALQKLKQKKNKEYWLWKSIFFFSSESNNFLDTSFK